jgi:UDP-N-acetyl-alpha-D-quinovosamine dehydrogenase
MVLSSVLAMPKIAVTGSEGFIGRGLRAALTTEGHEVWPVAKGLWVPDKDGEVGRALVAGLGGVHAVVHLAARAHVIVETHSDPLAEYRRVNLEGTLAVARAAINAGVSRMVFVSSIGVLGNTSGNQVFSEDDRPSPCEPYAVSKWEAEQALHAMTQGSPVELVVVRPPLVYGPHVKGNLLRLLRLVERELPLPLGSVHNLRSYVGLTNLCDLLIACIFHPGARDRTFHVADGEDVSTPQLLQMMAAAMGRHSRIFRCPVSLLRGVTKLLGKQAEFERMTGNLRVDARLARAVLGWSPKRRLEQGISDMVRCFIEEGVA